MRLEITPDRAILHAQPTAKLLGVLRQLEGQRRWLKSGVFHMIPSAYNIERLRTEYPALLVQVSDQAIAGDVPNRPPYQPRTIPFPHQQRALAKARTRDAFALFMEQGTGKTKVAIDRAGELWSSGKINAVLVVAKKGVHRQWINSQVPEHCGCRWSGAYWNGKAWTDELASEMAQNSGLTWRAINYDGIKTAAGRKACVEFVAAHRSRIMIVADESQEIKNPRAARHKVLEELKLAACSPYRMILTGTPIAVDLVDEWAQLRWLDDSILGMRYIAAFRNEYCVLGGYEGRRIVGYKNLEKFRRRVEPAQFRVSKEDVGILPKLRQSWTFDLSVAQKHAIKQIRQEFVALLESGQLVTVENAATVLIRIQQISSGFLVAVGNCVTFGANPRLDALEEILTGYEGKTIVWARFVRDIQLIAERLVRLGIKHVEYYGATSDKARDDAVRQFLAPGGPRVFLSNPQAGGVGLNLQGECRHAVYYSHSFNAIDRWQSEDRIHRIGTTGPVMYTDIIANGGIDKAILANLKQKKGLSELALADLAEVIRGV